MGEFYKREPVLVHAAVACVLGIASTYFPGIETTTTILVTAAAGGLARAKVAPAATAKQNPPKP